MFNRDSEFSPLRIAILTVSNSRTISTDTNGLHIQSCLAEQGHQIIDYAIVKDDKEMILKYVYEWVCSVDVVVTSGGTGLAKRDVTLEAIKPLFDKEICGFGELFRLLSYKEIGPRAMGSRTTAGLIHQALVFCLPGATRSMKLAMEKLVLPAVSSLMYETKK